MKPLLWIFKAVANQRRIGILEILHQKRETTLNDIMKRFRISKPAAVQHLKKLEQVGMIKSHMKKSKVYFTLNPKRVLRFNRKIFKMIKQQRTKR
ncbi:MAG: metalloregulator ArsR/SmtB family transcription factor [Elusimicrobiota bacterium]